jgi:hypothetical protein
MPTAEAIEDTSEKLPVDMYRQVGIFIRRSYAHQRGVSKEFYCSLSGGLCKRTLKGDTIGEIRAKIDLALIDRSVGPAQ